MVQTRKNIPKADSLMGSMRSIGYTFESAIADIIDNSISASKAIISTLQSKLADSKVFDIDKLNASKNELNKLKSELNNEIKNTLIMLYLIIIIFYKNKEYYL